MSLIKIYQKLRKAYGKQGWWPTTRNGKTSYYGGPINDKERLEVCIGAILTQNTSWKNAEKAIRNMHAHNLVNIEKISKIERNKLAKIIRSSGFHNQKSERLKIFCSYIMKNYGSLKRFFVKDAVDLRKELLLLKGIGLETADSIMLYAADKPVFVIDSYTRRIFSALGFLDANATYDEWQQLFEKSLRLDKELFKEYHALIVEHAKRMRNGDAIELKNQYARPM
ncbi:MAG: endonuclease [Candidatus Aenigmatarchaeota archaeon]